MFVKVSVYIEFTFLERTHGTKTNSKTHVLHGADMILSLWSCEGGPFLKIKLPPQYIWVYPFQRRR